MQYLKLNKRQKLEAKKVHQKCFAIDQRKMKKKQHLDRVEKGIYRIAR